MTTATDIVQYDAPATLMAPHNLGGLPYLGDFCRLAGAICKTEMVPQSLRGRADAVVAVMMSGFEIGVGPMQALQSINLIQGKPSLSAELMRALISQAGHQFRPEATNEQATVTYRRKEWAPDQWSTVTFTIADAQRAGLVEWHERWVSTSNGKNFKETWNPYGPDPKPEWADEKNFRRGDNYFSRPRAMLSARATSEAARLDFADVIAGLSYTPDEIEEFAPIPTGLSTPGEVAVIDAQAVEPTPRPAPDPEAEEQMKVLADLIRSVDGASREQLMSHLRGRFGASIEMTLEQIQKAIPVAAGWPESADASTEAFKAEQAAAARPSNEPLQGEPF